MNNENATVNAQLETIRSMLESGHKTVFMERHTLPLWGVAIGLLILFTGDITRSLYRSSFWKGFTVEAILIAGVLLIVTTIDFRLVKAARARRDESLTIVQRRLTRMVWLLFAFGFLLDLYAITHLGSGSRVLGLYVVLGGIALYTFGLFSESWYRWSGCSLLIAGIIALFAIQPGTTQRLFVACVFIIGAPLIGLFAEYAHNTMRRLWLSIAWVLLVILGTAVAQQLHYALGVKPGDIPIVTLSEYQNTDIPGRYIVSLPAGTDIPAEISIDGDILSAPVSTSIILNTNRKIYVELDGNRLTGVYRIDDGAWLEVKDALYTKSFVRKTQISKKSGPQIQRKMVIGTERRLGGLLGSE